MVIGLKQLIEKIEQFEKPKLERLEEQIDEALINRFNGEQVTIDLKFANGLRLLVVDGLLNKYREVGWKAKINYDQRDGDYISFETEKTESYGGQRK